MESRGIDMVSVGPLPVWTSTMVSVRWPAALPVWSFLRCSAVRPLRESLPTSR